MAKCQAQGCHQDAVSWRKECDDYMCDEYRSKVVCENHKDMTFYVCSKHKRVGSHPFCGHITHTNYFEYKRYHYGRVGDEAEHVAIFILNKYLAIYGAQSDKKTTYQYMLYNNNIFPEIGNPYRINKKINEELAQEVIRYIPKSYWPLWKTLSSYYPSALPTDICNIISLYL